MLQKVCKVLSNQRGATFLEYVFLAVIILVAGIVIFRGIGKQVTTQSKDILDNFTEQ
jgi:Flp pilus assembly pilin Flp